MLYTRRSKKLVEYPHGIKSIQPLLRSPFLNARQVAVSSKKLDPMPASLVSAEHNKIAKRIIDGRIGGDFWKAAPILPSGSFHVVALPADLKQARQCWNQTLTSNLASDLLVIMPDANTLAPLRTEIAAFGAQIVTAGNPHAILDIARSVHADMPCDLTILAELAGLPVFHHPSGATASIAPGNAIAWISEGTIYQNPYTGAPASCADTVELLIDWARIFNRNRSIAVCNGMSMWKRRRLGQLLHTGEAPPLFVHSTNAALQAAKQNRGAIAVWSTRMPIDLATKAPSQNIAVQHVEDGFIRGAGLGSGLAPPASIVVDRQGIYYDPSQPSDLETLIASTEFSGAMIIRAQQLIKSLVAGGISKYGTGSQSPLIKAKPGQRKILVPGQVADDFSIKLGACGWVQTNAALLAVVRARNPDAFIVYRPHPDVAAGHRDGAIENPAGSGLADQVTSKGGMGALLENVDEVHTMTSLTGFEALLRGRMVETYGQPFYAGWGLTTDHMPIFRRRRRITIEQLTVAALILYPLYIDPQTGLPCGPEVLISRLQQRELWRPGPLMHLRRLQGLLGHAWRRRQPVRNEVLNA